MSTTTLVFCLAFLGGAVLALSRHPMFGLLTYVGVFYLSPSDRWWGSGFVADVRWSLLAAALTLISILIHRDKLPPVMFWRRGPVLAMALFVGWLAIQLLWVMDTGLQLELLTMYAKFIVVLFLILKCIDSTRRLLWFLWAHLLGSFYFGLIVFTSYAGGRFEGFGGPGLDDANAGALALATGVLVAAGLFLAGRLREKLAVTLTVPLVLNGLVATVSRSGFLAIVVGGAIFNVFAPRRFRVRIMGLSVLGLILLILVTNPTYWARIASIKYKGADIENVDTGGGRLEIIDAQRRMFQGHPLGCGHRCTAILSPSYLDARFLTGEGENRARSSHNTFMSLLVEQGVVGAAVYIAMVIWVARSLFVLRRRHQRINDRESALVPTVAAILGCIIVGDMFVDFLKFEIRIWYIGIAMVLLTRSEAEGQMTQAQPDPR